MNTVVNKQWWAGLTLRSVARLGVLCGSLLAVSSAAADEPAPPLITELPSVRLKLLEPFSTGYWHRSYSAALAPFADETDVRLKLQLETYKTTWGPLTLSTRITLSPPGEEPVATNKTPEASARVSDDTRRPVTDGTVVLKLNLGDVGPAKEVGPFIESGARPAPKKAKPFLRFGFGGKF